MLVITMRPGPEPVSPTAPAPEGTSMTPRAALIASLALTIAIALGIGSQWDLLASRTSPADPTPAPSAPAEQFVDPAGVDSTTEGAGVAAQTGMSLAVSQPSESAPETGWSEERSDDDWDEDDHEDDDDDHDDDDEHEDHNDDDD